MTRKKQGHAVNLTDAIHYIDRKQPARLTASGNLLTGSSAGMDVGGQLNPAHSLWLMGFPHVWLSCAVMAMRSIRGSRKNSSKQ